VLIVMRVDAAPVDVDRVITAVAGFGGAARVVQGQRGRVTLAVTGGGGPADGAQLVAPRVDGLLGRSSCRPPANGTPSRPWCVSPAA
jgi:hypothetical protein